MGECVATSCGALLQEIKEQNFPPKKWLVFRVLELKTREKWRRSLTKKMGLVARCIYSLSLTETGNFGAPASFNALLTEAVTLYEPPRVID
jgi:hypothetical protein